MPRSYPTPPDVRVINADGPAVIDAVQATTGGDAPYCRRCGDPDTVRPHVLAGLIHHIPDHQCGTPTPQPDPQPWISILGRLN